LVGTPDLRIGISLAMFGFFLWNSALANPRSPTRRHES
jgi:hypothetical protein